MDRAIAPVIMRKKMTMRERMTAATERAPCIGPGAEIATGPRAGYPDREGDGCHPGGLVPACAVNN